MKPFTLYAPAKINLYLAVLGRRRDGNHALYTLFQRLSLTDRIIIKETSPKARPFTLTVTGHTAPVNRSNLIYAAYERVKRLRSDLPNLSVRLRKRIPVAAGLGGGSSDAGTFLCGVNRRFNLGLTVRQLTELAGGLGADVPFFLTNLSTAVGTGRGDKLQSVAPFRRFWCVLVTFPKGLKTKEIYKYFDRKRQRPTGLTKAKADVNILSKYLVQKDLSQVGMFLRNDLRASSEALKPAVRRVLNFLKANGAPVASVTGSGPTCFAVTASRRSADKIARATRRRFGYRVYVCHSF